MKFLWLKDPLIRVLFKNEDIIAIDKPYGFDTHTNESKVGASQAAFVQPGLIELYEKQLGCALHVVHRLDKTTTGVLVFARSEESAARYRSYFRERQTEKTYVFATRGSGAVVGRAVGSRLSCSEPILRNRSLLEASTDFRLLSREGAVEIWEASPHTGRNHQIRIHAAFLGLPLLGDEKYGGAKFPFICLHNRRMKFPGGVILESSLPSWDFGDPARALALMEIDKRMRLFSGVGPLGAGSDVGSAGSTSLDEVDAGLPSLRLVHLPEHGLFVDQLGPRRVMTWHDPGAQRGAAKTLFRSAPDLSALLRTKDIPKDHWVAREGSLKFQIRAESGVGLFLDQRLQRQWVLENSRGKSVLNLFAYTCGYSIAALLGGASSVISVDSNKNMLNWGRENFVLNGLDPSTSVFLCRDAVAYLESAAKPCDLVICDPPNFSRGDKGLFKIEQQIEGLLRGCLRVGRQVLFSTNSETLFVDDIRRLILKIAPRAEIVSLQPSLDFEAPGEKVGLKSFLISNGTGE